MNILQLKNILKDNNLYLTDKEIASCWGMDKSTFSKKQKIGSEIKLKYLQMLEEYYKINLRSNNNNNEVISLKYYEDAYAAAGNGGFGSDNFTLLDVNKNFIHNYNSNYEYSVINCVGNSMEPLLMPSDLLIVRHCNYIIDNKIHVFYYDSKLYVKYLSNNLNQIVVRSLNADYPVRYIDNDVNVLGVVSGLIRWL